MRIWLLVAVLSSGVILLNSCEGKDPYVKIYDNNLTQNPPPCLALRLFPSDPATKRILTRLYKFDSKCPYTLSVSSKAQILCRQGANAASKATSNFPSAYLRMELQRGMRVLYSYYIDLNQEPTPSQIEAAFARMSRDIHLLTPRP